MSSRIGRLALGEFPSCNFVVHEVVFIGVLLSIDKQWKKT